MEALLTTEDMLRKSPTQHNTLILSGLIHDTLTGPFIIKGGPRANYCLNSRHKELQVILQDVPFQAWLSTRLYHDSTQPHFGRHGTESVNGCLDIVETGNGQQQSRTPWSPDLTPFKSVSIHERACLIWETEGNRRFPASIHGPRLGAATSCSCLQHVST
jgi:hypothetical protein